MAPPPERGAIYCPADRSIAPCLWRDEHLLDWRCTTSDDFVFIIIWQGAHSASSTAFHFMFSAGEKNFSEKRLESCLSDREWSQKIVFNVSIINH